MNKDNIYIEQESQDKLLAGIDGACSIIAMSYGPSGSNVLLGEDLYPFHSVTNDGRSIIEKIKYSDPFKQIGVDLMKELGDKAEKDSGDGRKTTMILANEIIKWGKKVKSATPMEIKRSLDECVPLIIQALNEQKKTITPAKIGRVASIATEDEKIGYLLQDIYTEIGKNGIVEIDHSGTFETSYELKEGVRLRNAGYIAPYMATEGDKAVYDKPLILITKQKISTINDLDHLLLKLKTKDVKSLVIYCEDIDPTLLGMLAMTHANGIFKTLIIKSPKLWKDWLYEDFAKITGATIIAPENGVTLATVDFKHLGTCDRISTTREETTVMGIKNIKDHIENLRAQNTEESKLRLAWLETKAAILKLGANSESELSYISKKARDGRNASFLALKDGVVTGGGVTLMEIAKTLPNTIGGNILREALQVPNRQILINGLESINPKVLDPVLVVKNAVINAVSVAGTVLTTRVVIPIIKE